MERYKNIQYYAEISSTNETALEKATQEKLPEFTVIAAHSQTKGKGQRGNTWESNPGENLTFSIVLYPTHIAAAQQFIISECISLAVADALSEHCKAVSVKWPNDIFVGNKKIAGILIEHILLGQTISTSVVGVGINCNQTVFSEYIPHATSLHREKNTAVSLPDVLEQVLNSFYTYYNQSMNFSNSIHQEYIKRLYKLHTLQMFTDKNGEFQGQIIDVEKTGILHIQDNNNKIRKYAFKEVAYIL